MATNDWLLLRLPARDELPLAWAAADADGQLLSMPSTEVGAGLHTMSTGRRVVLLVPAARVSQFAVALPAGNEARMQQLAPFALEDQVSGDIDDLHFAVGSRDAATGQVPVAVTDRESMQQWLARAAELQLLPRAMFSESDLAPALPGHVSIVLVDDQLLMRNEAGLPVLMPASDPVLALEMLLGPDSDMAAAQVSIHGSPEDWARHSVSIETLRDRVAAFKVHLGADGLLSLFASGLSRCRPINLLQGTFRPQTARRGDWRQWRAVAGAAAALLALQVGSSWWEARQLRQASNEMDQTIRRTYEAIFPGQNPGADPLRTLERRLKEVAGGSSQRGDLLYMLAAVAAARENVPVTTLQSLTYRTGALTIKLSGPDASALEEFSQALRAGDYQASLTTGSQQEDSFEGQIEMELQGT